MYIQESYSEDSSDFSLLESLFESLSEVSSSNLLRANSSYDVIVENYDVLSGALMDSSKIVMISEAEEKRMKVAADRFVVEAEELEEQMRNNKSNVKGAVKVATIAALLAVGFRLLVTKKLGSVESKVLSKLISIIMGSLTGWAIAKSGSILGYLRLARVYRNRLNSLKARYADDPAMSKKIEDAITKIDSQLKKKEGTTSESVEIDFEHEDYSIVNENIDMINECMVNESMAIMLSEGDKERTKTALDRYLMDTNDFIEHWKKSNNKGILLSKAMTLINLGLGVAGLVMWLYPPARVIGSVATIVGYVASFIGGQKSAEIKGDLARLTTVKSKLVTLRAKCKKKGDKEKIDLIIQKIDHVGSKAASASQGGF